MKTFAITPDNQVRVIASRKEIKSANLTDAQLLTNRVGFTRLARAWPMTRLVELWNQIPGAKPVKKFTDRKSAMNRIWEAIQKVGQPAAEGAPADAPSQSTTKLKRSRKSKAKKVVRADSKKATILALVQRQQGASIKEIMDATGWQAHSVRGFISGTLGK